MTVDVANSTIVSQAFRFMRLTGVSALSDDSRQARAATEQYPIARDMVLESYDWSIARRVAPLAVATVADLAADPDLGFAYLLPGDLLKLRHVYGDPGFRLDGSVIRSSQGEGVTIRYTRRIERENDLSAMLKTAIAYQLGLLLAPEFVSDRTNRVDMANDAARALQAAREADHYSASATFPGLGPTQDVGWTDEALR